MTKDAPHDDIDEAGVEITAARSWAAGVPAVARSLRMSADQMGVRRSAATLTKVNQKGGFDCPGCAWPEGQERHRAEFCENGAKAVAEEATLRTVGREFFAAHPISALADRTDWWLGQQGRLTEPMIRREGSDHYEPIGWDDAVATIAAQLQGLSRPDEAIFYTSGRTSNEAAFLYQLLVRGFGTNNLPDCSNMCHESSGAALNETIGVGKGTVTLEDVENTDLLVVVGQNPGTNHPRMLTSLERAKGRGAAIVAVNPLPEAGLKAFRNPQTPRGVVGRGTALADDHLQVRLGGDLALFQGVGRALLVAEAAAPGTVVDAEFVAAHTSGFETYRDHVMGLDPAELADAAGVAPEQIEALAGRFARADRAIVCWAMGLTQHKHSVPTIREIVNVMLLRGNLGRQGAGVCPVRGHSNVQGDRTMGIYERMPEPFLAALDAEFAFTAPREPGLDTVDAIRALRDGRASFFLGMGGNFVRATPDSAVTEAALQGAAMTVQVSTKLNRSHVVCGRTALILPVLGRTDHDLQASGEQVVTVEDSMGAVHASGGVVAPVSPDLLSEVAVVCRIARATLGDTVDAPWELFEADYRSIRARIARVVPGFEDFEKRIGGDGGGFLLPNAVRDSRRFDTATGTALFTANQPYRVEVPPGRLLLQTLRSHDQYNTTIYGLDDHYRGVSGGRRVVMVHPDDLAELGFATGDRVNLVSEWTDGSERRAADFRVMSYDTARGCAAAYYPETNVLVPLDSVADISNTPTSKSVVVRLEPMTTHGTVRGSAATASATPRPSHPAGPAAAGD